MKRIQTVKSHIERKDVFDEYIGPIEQNKEVIFNGMPYENKFKLKSRKDMMNNVPNEIENEYDAMATRRKYDSKGHLFLYWEKLARKFSKEAGKDGYSNVGIAYPFFRPGGYPFIDFAVIIGNYKDAKRIAEKHVKKSIMYQTTFLADGVLGTNDNEMWRHQRKSLSEAFLPETNLKRVFPISRNRAEHAIMEKIPSLFTSQDSNEVEINEFFLFEAMAQLQLALLGETEEKMEEWNKHIRQSFLTSLVPRSKDENGEFILTESVPVMAERRTAAMRSIKRFTKEAIERGEKRVEEKKAGPVMENIISMCPYHEKPNKIKRDSTSTFLFAGHDTTANLMTHFIFEMSKNSFWCKKVQEEVDAMFDLASSENRQVEYDDLRSLQVMKRCLNETLRLWPSVPNGTFREFEEDDFIQGYNNQKVKVYKGTQLCIPVWLLHRNPELWERADEFHPDREWLPEEDWYGEGLSGHNPASHRFCPFTFKPRDCMGRNFAQMEARLILASLLRMYDVSPSEQTRNTKLLDLVGNFGTLGAKKGLYVTLKQRRSLLY